MKNLQRLLKRVRNAGFPDLKDTRIKILYCSDPEEEDYFAVFRQPMGRHSVYVYEKGRRMPVDAIVGGIAHELSHIVINNRFSDLGLFFDDFFYESIASYNIFIERLADKIAIERGFGRELLTLARFTQQFYSDGSEQWNPFSGLSPREIVARLDRRN